MTEVSGQTNPPEMTNRRRLSAGRWAIIALFGLLAVGFFLRLVQYGYDWFSGAESADLNYRALTVWSLIYVVVCTAIALLAWRIPAEKSES